MKKRTKMKQGKQWFDKQPNGQKDKPVKKGISESVNAF